MNKPVKELTLQTVSLIAGFMVWVIISSLLPFIKGDVTMTAGQLAWVTAVPVILGSVLRVPIGFWTNRFGARWSFSISFIVLLFPVYYISVAHSFSALIIAGFFLGIGGAIFSVGVTSLPKYYDKSRHGFVNGIYGVGNIGTAVTSFSAPIIAGAIGWRPTVQLFLVLVAAFALINFFIGDRKETRVKASFFGQFKGVYKDSKLWFLCLFYFITFGSFVAFTIYLPNFLVSHFALDKVDAGLRTAGFIALATFLRPLGGYLGDKFNSFVVLMVIFAGLTLSGVLLSFSPSLMLYTVGCLAIAVCAGIGNGAVFKIVPLYYHKEAGVVNGIVAMMGGLGGFFPPLILTSLFSLTRSYSIGFMALSEFALAALIIVFWMYHQEQLFLSQNVLDNTVEGMMLTDLSGKIKKINPAFTAVTGYTAEEIVGETPRILHSGKQGQDFYEKMWESIKSTGSWKGEIWNRRKNGEIYPEWLTISAVRNEAEEVKYYVGMFSELPADRQLGDSEVAGL